MTATARIGLDATYALDAQPTGVGVYCAQLLRLLPQVEPAFLFRWYARPHRWSRLMRQRRSMPTWPLLESTPRRLDLFHGLNQRLPHRKRTRSICTFHDLFVMTGEYSTPEFRERFTAQARHAARDADLIIAVSQFTASQVRDLLNVPEARLRVVPHGVTMPAAVPDTQDREPIILHTGAIQKRKNLAMLIRAFAAAPPGWQLHLVGGDGFEAAAIHQVIEQSPRRADIVRHGYASAADLDSLYRRASLFAFPSWAEGFGIPVLEAMAYGIPVLASDQSAIPEAAQGAARLLNPADEEAWARALRELCEHQHLRIRMSGDGQQVARQSDWRRAAELTAAIYRELLV